MRKKKSLWSGVSILIVAVLAITAFIRGDAQVWLLAVAFYRMVGMGGRVLPHPLCQGGTSQIRGEKNPQKVRKAGCRKTEITVPDVSDSVTHVLLHHVNYRISAYLQSVYPEATWQWREEFPERIGSEGRHRSNPIIRRQRF